MKPKRAPSPSVEIEAPIAELAASGEGVAVVTLGGERRAVFVRGVVPGDRVRLAVDASTRPARGRLEALLDAGPDRVAPACPFTGTCGGCDWMHLSAEGQRRAHEARVRKALPSDWREHALVYHSASAALGYRTRARVHVRASGGRAIVGMNEVRTRDPIEVDRCAVLHPDLESFRARLSPLLEGAHGRGDAQIALGDTEASPRAAVLDLKWEGTLAAACYGRIERAVAEGWLTGAQIALGEVRIPARIGNPAPWMRGGDGAPLLLASGGFGQASDEGNEHLASRVAAIAHGALAGRSDARVLELYAGAGNFSVLLAEIGAGLVAVEAAHESCEAARANLAARGRRARIVEADASSFAIPAQTHLVVLDPPRTGARDVCGRLPSSSAKHVVYVSCDTQTLARDLELLAPHFAPRAIEVFALFPQTSHVETLIHLERRRSAAKRE